MIQLSQTRIILLCGPQAEAAVLKAFPFSKRFELSIRFTYTLLMCCDKLFIVCPPLAFNVSDASVLDNKRLGEALKFASTTLKRNGMQASFFENTSAVGFIVRAMHMEVHFQRGITLDDLDQGMRLWLYERAFRTDEEIARLGKLAGSLAKGLFILISTSQNLAKARKLPVQHSHKRSGPKSRWTIPESSFDTHVWNNTWKYVVFLSKMRNQTIASNCRYWRDDFLDAKPQDLHATLANPTQTPSATQHQEDFNSELPSFGDGSEDAAMDYIEKTELDDLDTSLHLGASESGSDDVLDLHGEAENSGWTRSSENPMSPAIESTRTPRSQMPMPTHKAPRLATRRRREMGIYKGRYYQHKLPPKPKSILVERSFQIGFIRIIFPRELEVLDNQSFVRFEICPRTQYHSQRYASRAVAGDPALRLAVEVSYQLPSGNRVRYYAQSNREEMIYRANTLVDVLEDGVSMETLVETPRRYLRTKRRDPPPEFRRFEPGACTVGNKEESEVKKGTQYGISTTPVGRTTTGTIQDSAESY